MNVSTRYKGFSGLQQQQIKKQTPLIRNLAFISDNLANIQHLGKLVLFKCKLIVLVLGYPYCKHCDWISLTNIPINKCVHTPNAYFS